METADLAYLLEWDPLVDYLQTLLLPELVFADTMLETVVETLRHLAGRAMASAPLPIPGGVSITLMATPAQRAQPITLRIGDGLTFADALAAMARQSGLAVVYGVLGVLLCPLDVAEAVQRSISQPCPPAGPLPGLDRVKRLRLVAHYPALGVTGSAFPQAWAAAFNASDRSPQAAFSLAHDLAQRQPDDGCHCQTQIPMFLPIVPEQHIPGLPR